jgi:hypothetical protein
LQELAAAASESGLQSPCIVQLANIGSAGNHPGNCHRDLIRILPKQPHAPAPYEIMVPMKSKHHITGAMETKEVPQHIVLPTDWFASMDDSGFASKLLGDIDACALSTVCRVGNSKKNQNRERKKRILNYGECLFSAYGANAAIIRVDFVDCDMR